MVIVAGHLEVHPDERDAYLAGCVGIVEQARAAPGCLDFSLSADLLDPGRINVLERWESVEAVQTFRGSGTDDDQSALILNSSVVEYDVVSARTLT